MIKPKHYISLLKEVTDQKQRNSMEGVNDRPLIVDALNSYIRVFSAVPAVNEHGDHIGGVSGFLRSIAWVVRMIKPTRLILVFDGKGGSIRRKDLYSDYKSGRTVNTKFNRPDHITIDVDQELRNMSKQLVRLSEYLDTLPITVISIDNVEADDVIAYMVTNVFNESKHVTVMSDDKDFLQLIKDNVYVWRPIQKVLYTPKHVLDSFGVPPHNYIIYKIMAGDASDNIKGVYGIGKNSLVKLYPELLSDTPMSVDELIEITKIKSQHSKRVKYNNILESIDQIKLNFKLMQLSDVDISGAIKSNIRDILNRPIQLMDRPKFKFLLAQDAAFNVFTNPDGWLLESFNYLNAKAAEFNSTVS